jgi:hypothetical protein
MIDNIKLLISKEHIEFIRGSRGSLLWSWKRIFWYHKRQIFSTHKSDQQLLKYVCAPCNYIFIKSNQRRLRLYDVLTGKINLCHSSQSIMRAACISGVYRTMNTGYGLDDRGLGVRVSVGSRIFSSPRHPHRLWGPSNLLSNGYRDSFPGVKLQGRDADHSPPTSAEIKKI